MVSLVSLRERVLVDLVRWAPKGTYSALVGVCARQPIPRRFRRKIYETFARKVGANLDEVELPLADYPTLDEFFARKLKVGARTIVAPPEVVISPCDGTVSAVGVAASGHLIQAKGRDYRLVGLLADRPMAARFEGGQYITIYLAPRDYHRVHFAVGGSVAAYHHIPGALFPVNDLSARYVSSLFARNERLVTYQETPFGEVATVMVAATGVGNIQVVYDDVQTHSWKNGRSGARLVMDSPRPVSRGDELGAFHLGSTVILLFEPGRVELEMLPLGSRVRLGEPIGRAIELGSEAYGSDEH